MSKFKLLITWGVILFTSACSYFPIDVSEFGVLEGHVTIGPLVPVLREGEPDPTPSPEVYAARKIVIFDEDGKTEVIRVDIDSEGNYHIELPAGSYVVDINHIGIDHAAGLPAQVEINPGEITHLNVDIDTGIR
jgi:hypothetical protein